MVVDAVINLQAETAKGVSIKGLSNETNTRKYIGKRIEEGDEYFSMEGFYSNNSSVTNPRLAGAQDVSLEGFNKPTDLLLEDLITGKASAIVKSDRMKTGHEHVFFKCPP